MSGKQRQTFAETGAEVSRDVGDENAGAFYEVPSLLSNGTYVDEQGVSWRLRGAAPSVSRVNRLMRDPSVSVLHVYDRVHAVPAAERERLCRRARPYYTDRAARRAEDQTEFRIGEFKADAHRSLLVIEEHC